MPTALALPLSLILHLCGVLLQPIYGTVLLDQHEQRFYGSWALAATIALWLATRRGPVQQVVSAKMSLCISAIGGDLLAVCGRQAANLLAERLGAERGAAVAQAVAGVLVVGGGASFAVLCSVSPLQMNPADMQDFMRPVRTSNKAEKPIVSLVSIGVRVAIFVGHIWAGRQLWSILQSSGTSVVERAPEKSVSHPSHASQALR